MIGNGGKKPGSGSYPAGAAGNLAEARRLAGAVARADERVTGSAAKTSKAEEGTATAQQTNPPENTRAAQDTGFDPYNSGSFDRKHAWSKVGKR
ncbi:MAG: hypothetical protein ABSF94_01895 [Steroidobacteraceae bacterium]|jgi:hypothetical protein